MTVNHDPLRLALLELGLEDDIPIPEAFADPEVRAAIGQEDPFRAVSRALQQLLREGRIRLFCGRWDEEDAAPVPDGQGVELLADAKWYAFHTDDPEEQRMYFANIDNVRGG